jgi:hypothetical protein
VPISVRSSTILSTGPQCGARSLNHQGRLGIAGNADRFDGVVFTDASGERRARVGQPAEPDHIPTPNQRHIPPLTGRSDWNWIGPGWIHPNAVEQQRRRPSLSPNATPRTAA